MMALDDWRDAVEYDDERGRFIYPDGRTELRFTPREGSNWGDVLTRVGDSKIAANYDRQLVLDKACEFAWLVEQRALYSSSAEEVPQDRFVERVHRILALNPSLEWASEAPMLFRLVVILLIDQWTFGEHLRKMYTR